MTRTTSTAPKMTASRTAPIDCSMKRDVSLSTVRCTPEHLAVDAVGLLA